MAQKTLSVLIIIPSKTLYLYPKPPDEEGRGRFQDILGSSSSEEVKWKENGKGGKKGGVKRQEIMAKKGNWKQNKTFRWKYFGKLYILGMGTWEGFTYWAWNLG